MTKATRERNVEDYFVAEVKRVGGEARKVQWVSHNGAPDRFVALNGAHFVELKRPKGKPEAHQVREHERLAKNGVPVRVIDTFEKVDAFIKEVTCKS